MINRNIKSRWAACTQSANIKCDVNVVALRSICLIIINYNFKYSRRYLYVNISLLYKVYIA